MPGEPALDKVLAAVRAVLVPLATTVDIDRPEDRAYGNAELDAINIVERETTFSYRSRREYANATEHRSDLEIEMMTKPEAGRTNAARLREMEAKVIAALLADFTLGGLVEDVIPQSSSGADTLRANVSGRTLGIQIIYFTPLGDHTTIIGAAGLIP